MELCGGDVARSRSTKLDRNKGRTSRSQCHKRSEGKVMSVSLSPRQISLGRFLRDGDKFQTHFLRAQNRMSCGKVHCSRQFFCADPDCSRAANQGERVVADDIRGAFKLELDGIVGEWANRTKFISNPKDDPGRIGPICVQSIVVGMQGEFLVDTFPGEGLGDHLLVLQVTLNS